MAGSEGGKVGQPTLLPGRQWLWSLGYFVGSSRTAFLSGGQKRSQFRHCVYAVPLHAIVRYQRH